MARSEAWAWAAALASAVTVAGCVPQDAPSTSADPAGTAAPLSPAAADALFIENVGQFPPAVRFMVRGGGEGSAGSPQAWITDRGLWLTAWEAAPTGAEPRRAVHLELRFDGAAPVPRIAPFGRVTGTHVSYFVGDPSSWRADVPLWTGVRYVDLYPGVDLVLEADGRRWTPRIEVRSAEARAAVRVQVDGADHLAIGDRTLAIDTAIGSMVLPFEGLTGAPTTGGTDIVEQDVLGTALTFSTYLGGKLDDSGRAIAVGPNGDRLAVTGYTRSDSFPTTPGVFDRTFNGGADAFVTGMTSAGMIAFSTYLGGKNDDFGFGIAIGNDLSIYVTGQTASADFPTTVGGGLSGATDAFVTRLTFDGTGLIYSTCLGGASDDVGHGIAVTNNNDAYVVGTTASAGFPVTGGAFDTTWNGVNDAFVTHLDSSGSMVEGTFLGGKDQDLGLAIAIDTNGDAFITGQTFSAGFPVTAGSFNPSYKGNGDAFVVELKPDLSAEIYGGFLGAEGTDGGNGIALDPATGAAHVIGMTSSTTFPVTAGAPGPTFSGGTDVFVTRVAATGAGLTFSTYLGSPGRDIGFGIAVRNSDDYLVGVTDNAAFPVAGPPFDPTFNGGLDAFVARIKATGPLAYSTFLGGASDETGYAIAVAPSTDVYVTGETKSNPFPTVAAVEPSYSGGLDAFVTRF